MDSSGLRKVFLKLLIVAKARINDGFCYIGWDLDRYKLARPLLRLHNPRWSSKDDKLRVGDTHLFKEVSFQPAWKRSLASLHRRCSRKTLRTQSTRGGQSLWRWIVNNLIDTESRNCKKGLRQYGSNQRETFLRTYPMPIWLPFDSETSILSKSSLGRKQNLESKYCPKQLQNSPKFACQIWSKNRVCYTEKRI